MRTCIHFAKEHSAERCGQSATYQALDENGFWLANVCTDHANSMIREKIEVATYKPVFHGQALAKDED